MRRTVLVLVAILLPTTAAACTPEQVLAAAANHGITLTPDQAEAISLHYRAQNPTGAREVAQTLAANRGWAPNQFNCLNNLWGDHESGWRWWADNPNSTAYGIPQALPGSKMASHGADWRTNGYTQIRWGLDYIANRYGTPCNALRARQTKGWY